MSAPLFVIKRGTTLLRSAIAGSAFSSNSRGLCSNPRGLSKFDTLLMARRMEARSKLRPELKSDQAYAFWMQHKKMRDGFRVDFHVDKLSGEMKELQKTIRDCFVATTLVGVYILGYAVFAAQKQHKKG